MKLIDKDALVVEIKRIEHETNYEPFTDEVLGKRCTCRSLLSFLDTLEVKEVDLEKYYHDFLQKEWFDKNCNRTLSEMMVFTAKHFFELGLKAQKGE